MELTELKRTVRQYLSIKNEAKLIAGRESELKKRLLETVNTLEPDDRGHKSIVIDDETVGEVKLTKQRKVSKSLDMDVAETVLTKRGIRDACITMVPVLDESAIMAAYYEGKLTEADIDEMFPQRESFAFIVTEPK